ncbi:hypothetical protein [Streptomyces carpinensis]|uniref:Lipoprotein n=1 Tax=Streptomyces carpinensis TaxID=66369 RepID=A0ABV1W568_9ACTN|nr:hypothetical protein [Streptomyces carpinensis]
MSSLVIRRTALAASGAALALLATACGGSSDGGDKGGDGSTAQADKTASAAPAARTATAAELEKAALAQADVASGKVTTKVTAGDDIAQDKVKAENTACAPLALLQAGTYTGKPAATAKRSWLSDQKKPKAGAAPEDAIMTGLDRTKVVETLASYADGGAEQAMKDLKKAAQKCAGGFAYTALGTKTTVVKVAVTDAPQGADEALALTSTVSADGVKFPMKSVVVRKGATLAYFPAVNLASGASGKDFAFPADLVQVQLTKLAKLG